MLYNNVKKISSDQNISISKMESDLQFSRGSVCKWNDNIPSIDKVVKVANYLSVDINELIGDSVKNASEEPKAG